MTIQEQQDLHAANAQAPIIIWTLRRTGGTNLGSALFERSPCHAVQQEPFNEDRMFGEITKAFRASGDETVLRAALAEILARKVLIKHCVETVPARLSDLLAEEAVAAGYRHVFLYRRHALGRLLSLHYAQRSGVWGKSMLEGTADDAAVFAEPLPVDALLRHEKECRRRLHDVYLFLRARGAHPLTLAFEDIYAERDTDMVKVRLLRVLFRLCLDKGDRSDADFIKRMASGEQGTRDKYSRFVNYRKLVDAAGAMPDFNPAVPELKVNVPAAAIAGLAHFTMWKPTIDGDANITLGGVAVPEVPGKAGVQRFSVEDAVGLHKVKTGLPSTNLATQFPDLPGAAKARFAVTGLSLPAGGSIRVLWSAAGEEPVEVARVSGEY